MDKVKTAFQNFGRVIVDPILYLSVTGIILAIATVCSLGSGVVTDLGTLLSAATNSAVIGNLPVIFAVGLTAGFAKKQKSNAAVFGLISYLMFLYVNNAYLTLTDQLAKAGAMGLYGTGQATVLGLQVTDVNVFGGVLIGCFCGWLYNKLIDVKVSEYIRIYGGPRLALLAMIPLSIVFGIGATIVWPPIANAISNASSFIAASGGLGVFIYGFLNRVLVPLGMHHFMWMPFDYSAIGGTAVVAGQSVSGAANIFYAELPHIADGSLTAVDPSVRFAMFGFGKEFVTLGTVLAMIATSRPENRKAVAAMLVPIYITAMLSGITEPLDFMILFASPILWGAYSLFYGLGEMLLFVLGVRLLNMYGGIELLTLGLPLPMGVTKFPIYIVLGIVFAAVSFIVLAMVIKKLNLMTPGRSAEWSAEVSGDKNALESSGTTEVDAKQQEMVQNIINGLGGKDNINTMGCCMTRLRVEVKDPSKVNEETIKKAIDKGLFKNGTNVQIVVGTNVHSVYDLLRPILNLED